MGKNVTLQITTNLQLKGVDDESNSWRMVNTRHKFYDSYFEEYFGDSKIIQLVNYGSEFMTNSK